MLLFEINHWAAKDPLRPALRDAQHTLNYAELIKQVILQVEALQALDQPSCIALALDNSPAWIVLDVAMLAAGWQHVPLPAFFTDAQKQHALKDAGVRWLLCAPEADAAWQALLPDSQRVATWQVAGKAVSVRALNTPPQALWAAKTTYTSGTTGAPKGVCLSAETMLQVATSLRSVIAPGRHDMHFCVLPLATLLENVAGVYASLISGACVTVLPCQDVGFSGSQFDIQRLYQGLLQHQATTVILIPELCRALVALVATGQPAPSHLRFIAVGGAKVAPALVTQAHALGLPVYEGYGLSECGSVVTLNTPQAHRPGSIGRPLPHVQMRVDAHGECWVKGALFSGYTQADGDMAPAAVDAEGYLATGDLGYQDADGFWFLSGRKKNMFITSFGRNLSPEWVETTLAHHAGLLQVCVFGEAQPFNVAVVLPPPAMTDAQLTAAMAAANTTLPDYARVARWLVARQPFSPHNGQLTANGRLKRDAIAAAYATELHALFERPL